MGPSAQETAFLPGIRPKRGHTALWVRAFESAAHPAHLRPPRAPRPSRCCHTPHYPLALVANLWFPELPRESGHFPRKTKGDLSAGQARAGPEGCEPFDPRPGKREEVPEASQRRGSDPGELLSWAWGTEPRKTFSRAAGKCRSRVLGIRVGEEGPGRSFPRDPWKRS